MSRAGGANAGSGADFCEHAVEVLGALEIVEIARRRSPDVHGEQVLGAEARIHGDEPGKATKHKARADRKKKGQGNFRDNKGAAESLMAADTAPESAMLQRALEIHARKTERGDESESHGSEKTSKEGKEQNSEVHRDRFAARQGRVLRDESEEAAESQLSEEQSRGHARKREKQTFDEKLPNDAGARGTQSGTNG